MANAIRLSWVKAHILCIIGFFAIESTYFRRSYPFSRRHDLKCLQRTALLVGHEARKMQTSVPSTRTNFSHALTPMKHDIMTRVELRVQT